MTIDLLVVTPFVIKHEHPHAHADGCTFSPATNFRVEVSFDDGSGSQTPIPMVSASNDHSASGTLPPSPRPLLLSVKVTPTGKNADRYWEIGGDIEYRGNAVWNPLPTTPMHFSAPPSLVQPAVAVTAFLNVWLSRVKDVTDRVIKELANIPKNRIGREPPPPTAWKIPPATTRFVADPPVMGEAIQVDGPATVDPNTTDLVFEVQGFKTPRLIAMCWPNALSFSMAPPDPDATFLKAAPAPFLIFFHAQHGQSMPEFYRNGNWPYGWDFLYFGLYHYLIYNNDVIQNWGYLGLPIQARRAGRNCIVIVPQNKFGPQGPVDEIVDFNDPELVQEALEEIQVHMYFRAGSKFVRPNIGRTAAGSMSNGNVLLTNFLNTHPGKPFLRDIVREIYVFDPNGDDDTLNAAPVDAALLWAKSGPTEDKRIRYFAQMVHPVHKRLLGGTPPSGNFVKDGTNPNFTGGVLNQAAWLAVGANDTNGHPKPDWQTPHQLIPGMLLAYAFKRSGF
jgi:hypothetical protein